MWWRIRKASTCRTSWTSRIVDRTAGVQLFLRFPSRCLRGTFVGNLHVSTNAQPMQSIEGALESSCRVVNGLGAGWARGGVSEREMTAPCRPICAFQLILARTGRSVGQRTFRSCRRSDGTHSRPRWCLWGHSVAVGGGGGCGTGCGGPSVHPFACWSRHRCLGSRGAKSQRFQVRHHCAMGIGSGIEAPPPLHSRLRPSFAYFSSRNS